MLCAENVSKYYNDGGRRTAAAVDVNLSVSPGEFLVLAGESGCGKTTLAKLLAGVIKPDEGRVLLEGREISPLLRRKDPSICSSIQMVLQDGKSSLDPRFTVFRSIAEPLQNLTRLSKGKIMERVEELMARLDLEDGLLERKPHELSGGQQKRVCIARAIATRPAYLIFDEAVSGLDVLVRKSVLELIRDLHKETQAGYVMITHDMDVALYLADRIAVMKDGRIVEECDYHGDRGCFRHPYTLELLEKSDPFS